MQASKSQAPQAITAEQKQQLLEMGTDVFALEHPLGQWRAMAQELYALELPLPQTRAAGAPPDALTP